MVGVRTRRIVTRSVSATGGQQGASRPAHVPSLPSSQEELPDRNDNEQPPAHDATISTLYQRSSEQTKGLPKKKRVSTEVEAEEDPDLENKRPKTNGAGLVADEAKGGSTSADEARIAGPSRSHAPDLKTPAPSLKRGRALDIMDVIDHPRKRQALDAVTSTAAKPPRLDLISISSINPTIPRSISLPDRMPVIFTPVGGRAEPVTAKRRRSADADAEYCDITIPLKGEEDVCATPLRSPEPPTRTAQFTFNPFAATGTLGGSKISKDCMTGKHTVGDTFGPAVASLSQLLEGDRPPLPHTSALAASTNEAAGLAPYPPSPTKAVLPSKMKPSMIPRLVLAPPPPPKPHPTLKSPSPTKSSFTKFFASPVKGSAPSVPIAPGRPPANKVGPPRFATGKSVHPTGKRTQEKPSALVRHPTTLSVEAQASLANLSVALEKLAMPRPSTSLGSSTSSAEGSRARLGTAKEEAPLDDDVQARLDELPPRPNTSLGVRSVHESGRTQNLTRQHGTTGRAVNASFFNRRASSSNLPATFIDSSDVVLDKAREVEQGPSSLKGKEKERTPLATIGGTLPDIVPESDCLAGCVIFVDVKTDDGSDASAMFVQMLRGLSAKIINRPGTTATHIIWKSGLQSTLTRYSSTSGPRPHLVGIGWVVQCVERKQKVEEKRFLVNVKEAEIHFGNKRRKSLQVKDRSAMTCGLVSTRPPPVRTVSNPNPFLTQSASSVHRVPPMKASGAVRSKVTQQKLPLVKFKVPVLRLAPLPSPVKEVTEPQEAETDIEEISRPSPSLPRTGGSTVPSVGPTASMETIMEPRWAPAPCIVPGDSKPTSVASGSGSRPNSARKEPMFSLTKAKATPPPLVLQTSSPSFCSSQKADPLADFHAMLADTQSSLLAEAQESQLDRARRRSLLFAPKVSSPLKKNFHVF
ncbi:hypothetical protein FRB97_006119 [Tulasnella sp. 331]|nr:hypothetical protein FRB97_006119 [Tulasnella sp. 331]